MSIENFKNCLTVEFDSKTNRRVITIQPPHLKKAVSLESEVKFLKNNITITDIALKMYKDWLNSLGVLTISKNDRNRFKKLEKENESLQIKLSVLQKEYNNLKNKKKPMKNILIFLLTLLMFTACNLPEPSTSERNQQTQKDILDRADAAEPIYQSNNFIARQMVNEYMRRMDQPNKLFYIYVITDMGTVIGYYVSRGPVVNICTFLSPPDRVEKYTSSQRLVRAAPALDGVYYGDGACAIDYFFDANTDALIQLKGLNYQILDQPLQLDVDQFEVQIVDE